MNSDNLIKEKIFNISSYEEFNDLALEIFHIQHRHNQVYNDFIRYLGINHSKIKTIQDIPFLPIEFFKTHKVLTGNQKAKKIFYSSGTGGHQRSKHYITDISLYEMSFSTCFRNFYGNPDVYCLLALLPSYMEQESSSLIFMVDSFISKSSCPQSGFFLNDNNELVSKIKKVKTQGGKLLLLGVSYALLELVENHEIQLPANSIVMETGGMKGRRNEMIREDLHKTLCKKFGVKVIHSEYGMTELLSQAYSKGKGRFYTPPWMKVLIRDINDPLSHEKPEHSGGINIIDLANLNSCSFIATQDIGKINNDGSFEVLGRFDHSEIRGCNLLVT